MKSMRCIPGQSAEEENNINAICPKENKSVEQHSSPGPFGANLQTPVSEHKPIVKRKLQYLKESVEEVKHQFPSETKYITIDFSSLQNLANSATCS